MSNSFYYPTSTRRHGNFAGVHTLLRILLSSNSAVLINIITGVSPPHFDYYFRIITMENAFALIYLSTKVMVLIFNVRIYTYSKLRPSHKLAIRESK
jgi:hypothetical protein